MELRKEIFHRRLWKTCMDVTNDYVPFWESINNVCILLKVPQWSARGPWAQTLGDKRAELWPDSARPGTALQLCSPGPPAASVQGKECWMISAGLFALGFMIKLGPSSFSPCKFLCHEHKIGNSTDRASRTAHSSAPGLCLQPDFRQGNPAFKIKGPALIFPSFDLPCLLLRNVRVP